MVEGWASRISLRFSSLCYESSGAGQKWFLAIRIDHQVSPYHLLLGYYHELLLLNDPNLLIQFNKTQLVVKSNSKTTASVKKCYDNNYSSWTICKKYLLKMCSYICLHFDANICMCTMCRYEINSDYYKQIYLIHLNSWIKSILEKENNYPMHLY